MKQENTPFISQLFPCFIKSLACYKASIISYLTYTIFLTSPEQYYSICYLKLEEQLYNFLSDIVF